jgi:hypothetical protein
MFINDSTPLHRGKKQMGARVRVRVQDRVRVRVRVRVWIRVRMRTRVRFRLRVRVRVRVKERGECGSGEALEVQKTCTQIPQDRKR